MRLPISALLVCAAALAGACGPPKPPPPGGTLTVTFAPGPASVANLTLTTATLTVDHVQPIGNVPPQMPPPPMILTINALSPDGASLEFEHLPPGVYSRLQFSVDSATIQGTWRGTPLSAEIGLFGGIPVDLRSNGGAQLGPGQDATLTVAVDVAGWFAGDVLDMAMPMGGQILCDGQHNQTVTNRLSMQVNGSFTLE